MENKEPEQAPLLDNEERGYYCRLGWKEGMDPKGKTRGGWRSKIRVERVKSSFEEGVRAGKQVEIANWEDVMGAFEGFERGNER